jgi:RNA polymerase sigma factor (sigma-70 family)
VTGYLIPCPSISYLDFLKKSIYGMVISFVRMVSQSENPASAGVSLLRKEENINLQAEHILQTHGNSILRIAYSYLQNMSDAEDILQDTLIQFLKTAPVFENITHEKAWLMRVAINLSKNRIKYRKTRETMELDDSLACEESSDLSFVWDAVNSLPVKYREIIHLYYHEGYSTTEIASLLQQKENTVRSFLQRGRNQLKRILQEVYDFAE